MHNILKNTDTPTMVLALVSILSLKKIVTLDELEKVLKIIKDKGYGNFLTKNTPKSEARNKTAQNN